MTARKDQLPEDAIKKNLQLYEIAPSDLEEVARFISRVSGSDTALPRAVERLSWILTENPARESADPLGWLLRASSGEIAGCMGCAPQKFCFGQTTLTMMMANSFYVDDQYRGGGASIFLKYLQLGRRYPLFVSSASESVAEMWQKLGGYPLGNSDHEVIGILGRPPLVAESVYRKMANDSIARFTARLVSPLASLWPHGRRPLLQSSAEGNLTPLLTPEEAAGVCAEHHTKKITGCRDVQFLKWRYYSTFDSTSQLFAFRPNDSERKFMIAVRLQNRGYRHQIRALQVLDIWGEAEPQTCVSIAAGLWSKYVGLIDILVFRCLNRSQRQALVDQGFRIRKFPAPIAWCVDKAGLLPAKSWYFVPADGDMFL